MSRVQRIPLDSDPSISRHLPPGSPPGGSNLLDDQALSEKVLKWALELGFVRAGIASLEPFVTEIGRLEDFLARGRAGEMGYLAQRGPDGTLLRRDPKVVFPEARVALVVALPYASPAPPLSPPDTLGQIAAYAQGADYHYILKERLLLVADRLAEHLGEEILARACVDSAPLLERDLARRAGIAFVGKNTLAIAPGAGSHFVLGEVLLSLPLATSAAPLLDGCGSCTACLDACPTQAFAGPYQLDATRCISYLTIENKGPIPVELRPRIGNHLFGCDDCQAACPYNRAGAKRPIDQALAPTPESTRLQAADVLRLTSSDYKRLVRGKALRRVSRSQLARNAAIVLGNSGDEGAVDVLSEQATRHVSESVREHCIWALGELARAHGIGRAELALRTLSADQDERVASLAANALDSHAFEQTSGSHPSADTHGNHGEAPFSSR